MANFWDADTVAPTAAAPAAGGANFWDADKAAPAATAPTAAAQPSNWSSVLDFFKSVPRGALGGISNALSASGQAAAGEQGFADQIPSGDATRDILEKNVTGDLHKPEGRGGRYGAAVGEVLGNPVSYVGPGGLPMKVATGVTSAIGSEVGGDLLSKIGPTAGMVGRLGGAIIGGNVPKAAGRLVTPLPAASATRQGLVDTLENEGVHLTAGQATGRQWLKYWEGDLNPGINERQGEQFTRAALRRVGENADRTTPEVVDGAFRRIGGDFDQLSARNHVQLDQRLGRDLVDTYTDYAHNTNPSQRVPAVQNYIRDIHDALHANNGRLNGEVYQSLRSRLSADARGAKTDPALSHAYSNLTETLDDAMGRSIRRNNPDDIGGFDRARRQYRNMLVIERAAAGAGEGAANGLLTPAQLSNATKAVHGKRAYARGQGDFADLARAGQATMLPLPDSGTSQRNRINSLLHHWGGLMGAAAGGHAGGMEGGVMGLLAGELAGPLIEPAIRGTANAALMNPVTQMWLRNRRLGNVPGLFATAPAQAITATAR